MRRPLQHHLLLPTHRIPDRGVPHPGLVHFGNLRQRQIQIHALPLPLGKAHRYQIAELAVLTAVRNAHLPVALEHQIQRRIVQIALDPARIRSDRPTLFRIHLRKRDLPAVHPDPRPPKVVERQPEEEGVPVVARPTAGAAQPYANAIPFDGHPLRWTPPDRTPPDRGVEIERRRYQQPVERISMMFGQFTHPIDFSPAQWLNTEIPGCNLCLDPVSWRIWKTQLTRAPFVGDFQSGYIAQKERGFRRVDSAFRGFGEPFRIGTQPDESAGIQKVSDQSPHSSSSPSISGRNESSV